MKKEYIEVPEGMMVNPSVELFVKIPQPEKRYNVGDFIEVRFPNEWVKCVIVTNRAVDGTHDIMVIDLSSWSTLNRPRRLISKSNLSETTINDLVGGRTFRSFVEKQIDDTKQIDPEFYHAGQIIEVIIDGKPVRHMIGSHKVLGGPYTICAVNMLDGSISQIRTAPDNNKIPKNTIGIILNNKDFHSLVDKPIIKTYKVGDIIFVKSTNTSARYKCVITKEGLKYHRGLKVLEDNKVFFLGLSANCKNEEIVTREEVDVMLNNRYSIIE